MSIQQKQCAIEGCNGVGQLGYGGRRYLVKGYCQKHYTRLYRKGYTSLDRNQYEFHNLTYHPLYKPWRSMIQRCHNKNHPTYKKYGAKGITVCDRWRYSFSNFYEDMGERPKGMSLDRIDGTKGYYKENCRWADYFTQSSNQIHKKGKLVGIYQTSSGRYRAKFNRFNKSYHVGTFDTLKEAINARKKMIEKITKEYYSS